MPFFAGFLDAAENGPAVLIDQVKIGFPTYKFPAGGALGNGSDFDSATGQDTGFVSVFGNRKTFLIQGFHQGPADVFRF